MALCHPVGKDQYCMASLGLSQSLSTGTLQLYWDVDGTTAIGATFASAGTGASHTDGPFSSVASGVVATYTDAGGELDDSTSFDPGDYAACSMVVAGNLVTGVGSLDIGFKWEGRQTPDTATVAVAGPTTSYTRRNMFHLGDLTEGWVWYTDGTGHQFPAVTDDSTSFDPGDYAACSMVVAGNLVTGVGSLDIGFKWEGRQTPDTATVAVAGPTTSYTRRNMFHLGDLTEGWVWYTDGTGHQFPAVTVVISGPYQPDVGIFRLDWYYDEARSVLGPPFEPQGFLTTQTETVSSTPHSVLPRYTDPDGVTQYLPGFALFFTNAPPPPSPA
ncbi:hypothetical protein F751_3240 [Auxenochlorella protothecoides]|uniref:Uncharacterized protein n=1 Tax=Auxenochlorella protothecoides TaxID=3075 RepID=A0A087SFL8_AUXPR|nr:hypothetical protein F751_3240 [Auxenochlorella protothecoides]KFM24522.1 hypothetical protein F751_3240 [Auxenochlorella protothecoides]